MAESTLSMVYADLVRELERYLRIATGTETTWIDDLLRTGLRRFYGAHAWSFLRPLATLSTVAPYSTGTVTVVSGVVTLASGTFPSWAASGVLLVDGATYEISTRDSGTQVTLEDTSVNVAALTPYEVAQFAYDLPDDFGGMIGPLTYHPGLNASYLAPSIVDEVDLRVQRQYDDDVAPPDRAAIRVKTWGATTGTRYQILFAPLPDDVYQFTYRYVCHPDKIASTHYARGGMLHSETVRLAVLAAAELSRLDTPGPYEQLFQQHLALSIQRDKEMASPDSLGRMTDPCENGSEYTGIEFSRIDRSTPYTES